MRRSRRGNQHQPFDLKYIKAHSTPDEHGCWIWQGCRLSNGYAPAMIARRRTYVHRIACALAHGEIPEGKIAMHTCHRGQHGCVNPDHIKIGTRAENKRDWDCTGERHGMATVPDCVQRDVVRRYKAGGVSYADLVAELAQCGWLISKTAIINWVHGKTRRHAEA